jgi:hypothetical protein
MIGAIDEAKAKAKTAKPVAKVEPGSKTAPENDAKPADPKPKDKSEQHPEPEAKPEPKGEHAAASAHAS